MASTTITLRINADGSAAITSLDRVGAAAGKAGKEAEEGGRRGARGIKETSDAARDAARQVGSLTDFVKGLAGAWLSFQGVKTLVSMADQAAGLSARLRLASDSQREFNIAQSETFAIAQRTTTALESTVNLYARLRQSTQDYGIQQARLLALTETINQTFAVSGTEAAAQANAITQLTQAFAGGVLRAEEFNSVIENSPRLAKAFADGLGVSMGALRKMVNDGEVDIARMIAALEDQAGAIAEEYAQIPLTVERAWTQLTNAALRYVGEADAATGASRELAAMISLLAENVDKLALVAVAAAGAFGAWVALATPLGRLVTAVSAVAAVIVDLLDTTDLADEATQAYAESLRAATAANDGSTAASMTALAALRDEAQARLDVAKAVLDEANAKALVGDWLFWTPEDLAAAREAQANVDLLTERIHELDIKAGEAIVGGLSDFFSGLIQGRSAAEDISGPLAQFRQEVDKAREALDKARQKTAEYRAERQALILTEAAARGASQEEVASLRSELEAGDALIRQAQALSGARSAVARSNREAAQAKREAARAAEDLVRAERDLLEQAAASAAGEAGPDVQAQLEYERVVAQVSAKLAEMAIAAETAGAGVEALADAERAGVQIIEAAGRARDKKLATLANERDIVGRLNKEHAEQMRMVGMTSRELAVHQAVTRAVAAAYDEWGDALDGMPEYLAEIERVAAENAGALHDADEAAQGLEDILSRFDDIGMGAITDEIRRVGEALETATDPATVERLKRKMGELRQEALLFATDAIGQGINSLKTMTNEGSKAYAALEIAQAALNVSTAIGAIVNQGMGDPYTAFARMAAMAAAVASLGVNISGFGGGFDDTAAQRQASQGTGTVLGDSEAKSESILRATEITADATTELVGINRGMLRALIQLQDGIAGATGMLARGAGDLDWSGFNQEVGTNFWHRYGLAERLTGWFGARNEVTDQGLRIRGGSIQDLLNNMNVSAYNEMQGRSWWGGRTRTSTAYQGVDEDVANQFELIMRSIVDTVREAAIALGISAEDVEAALETYRQEEIRISLMDLDAEEQQAELQAVFSQIFDGIAGHVVPFVRQFQQVGEGLGETLVRVATSVQVVQESMRYLGLAINETDPERFAQISVALIDAVGGIEEFITGMQAFANAFAPEEFQFEANASALRDAFEQAGLAVPATREAMWDLMQSLDATTEEGREHIAMLLRLGPTADAYYDSLDRQAEATIRAAEASREYAAQLVDFAGTTTEFRSQIADIRTQERDAVARANELARAAGRQGAAERDLAHIHRWAAAQVAAAIQQLYTRTQELVQQLYGGGTYVHGQGYIQQEIDDFQAGAVGAINEIDNAMRQMYEAQLAAIQRIEDYLIQMQFGGLSALSPTEQLDAARQQLEVLQLAAQAGDADAMAALPQAAQQYLQLLQGAYASGDEFAAGYEWVRELLQGIVDAGPTIDPPGEEGGVWNGYPGLTPETLAERDAMLAEQEAAYRAELAGQLAQHLGDLALVMRAQFGEVAPTVLELAQLMGVSLSDLAADLGINLEEITGQSVLALASMADALGLRLGVLTSELGLELTDLGDGLRELLGNMGVNLDNITGATVESMAGLAGMLGLSLTELTTALGLELTDLAGGLTELTTNLGIDLGNLTTESTAALAGLARDLGIDLGELSTAVGADLGELTNSQSLLNQTFAAELATLPQRERDLLQPLLQAVTDATTEADANAAIADLEGAVNSLSPAIRDQLAPYLTGVFPAGALDDLDYLSMIHTGIGDLGWALSGIGTTLDAIRNNLSAANQDAGVPHYAAGGWVNSRTTLVAGEAGRELILPNYVSEFLAREGIPVVSGGGDPAVVAELRRIADRVERVEAAVVRADDRNVNVTVDADRNIVRAIDDSARDPINRRSGVHA